MEANFAKIPSMGLAYKRSKWFTPFIFNYSILIDFSTSFHVFSFIQDILEFYIFCSVGVVSWLMFGQLSISATASTLSDLLTDLPYQEIDDFLYV